MKKFVIDHFEDDLAVLLSYEEETVQQKIRREQLPDDVQEGDVLAIHFHQDGNVKEALIKREETKKRKKLAQSVMEKLKIKK